MSLAKLLRETLATAAAFLAAFAATLSAQTSVQIHDIMVAGSNPVVGTAATKTLPYSPYYGQTVSVTGIVVGVEASGDYAGTVYISEPSSNWDSLILTAEGMPVFGVSSINSACFAVGANVTVVGSVVLSTAVVPADVTAAGTPGTGILPTSCTTSSTGTMTQSISLGTTLNSFGGALEYTGMTTSATFYAVSPTSGITNATAGAVTSTGQFWATLSSNTATNNHLFRSTGIAKDEYVPTGSTAPTWAGNPQRILIDTTTFGGSPVNITVGQTISCVTGSNIKVGAIAGIGLIDYTLGYARLLIFPTSVCTVGGTVAGTTSAVADSTHFKVGTLDLSAFASTNPTFSTRLAKAASAIVTNLGAPDILSLQEVSDLPTLVSLASAVNTLGSASYVPFLVAGSGSTNVGFLVKSSTLTTDSVTQVGASSTYINSSGASATLWDSPPLVLKAEFVRIGKNYPVTVIDPLFTLRDNSGDPRLGADIRLRRAAQASAISQLVQQYQTAGQNVVVAGNLNAFEFSDGYVDVTGIIDGSPATAVSTYQATSTTAALTDFNTQVAATSRYNYIERGDAVTYEHILASATIPDPNTAAASLASYATTVTQPHFTADFYATNASLTTTPAGLTPHDGFVVAFLIPPVPTTASISASAMNFGSVELGASSTMSVTITNTTTFASTVNVTNIAISGTNATDFTQTSNCTALTQNQTCTITLVFAPTAIGARAGLLTVSTDATSNSTLTATLNGTGINTTATLTATTATFPSTDIGDTSAAQTFTFSNTSSVVSETVATAAVTGDFTLKTNTCTAAILPGGTCTLTVVFAPTATGARTGTLTVTNSSTGNPTLTSTLNGTGLDTTATLLPATLTFADTDIGGTSAAKRLTFTNISAIALTLSKVSITGDFTQTATTCTTSVAAGASCTYTLVFMPTAVGARTGTFTVLNSSTGNPTLVASLNGNGLDTTATLTPTSADFGSIYAGGGLSGTKIFTVTNTSAIAITIKSVTISGNFTQTNTCGTTLAAGASCTVSVIFAPLTSGILTGTLTVTNSTSLNPVLTATLTGTGLPTTASLSPLTASYPNTIVGLPSASLSFIWTNTSAIPLTITKVVSAGDFTVTSTTCTGLVAANAGCVVAVSFTPTALGARTGTVSVLSTSSANPTLTATLSGRGVADVEANVSSLNFGNVDLGYLSASQTITITNYTAATIALTSTAITGDYADTTTCGATIAGLSTCTVTITFTPTAIGSRPGTLTINTNDTKYPVITVALTGNGVGFSISVAPTSGNTIAGYSVAPNITLTPLGGFSAPLAISCTTTASGSLCTPQSPGITLTAVTVMAMPITTTSQYTVIGYGGLGMAKHPWLAFLSVLSAAMLCYKFRRIKALPRIAAAILLLLVLGGANLGCGSRDPDRNSGPTLPGTYIYTVSATDGLVTRTATYTLTVTVR